MKQTFLEFEQPIAELEAKIEELRYVQDDWPGHLRGNQPAAEEEQYAY
jgi:hypothetical protein